jgi:hypothetical protein
MKRSTERILTTHAGRLPNPDNIAAILHARDDDPATLAPRRLMGQRQDFCPDGGAATYHPAWESRLLSGVPVGNLMSPEVEFA